VIEIDLDPASVARVRVAASPVIEVIEWLTFTAIGVRHPVFGDPGAAARFALRDRSVARAAALLAAGAAQGFIPDFLTPKPPRGRVSIDEQVAAVEQTTATTVRAQLPAAWPAPAGLPLVVADGLMKFWRMALADMWPAVEDDMDNCVRASGAALTTGGVEELFATLQPALRWTGRRLMVAWPFHRSMQLDSTEVVIVPMLLSGHAVMTQLSDRRDAWIGVRARPGTPLRRAPKNPTTLLGRGRTAVLVALQTPASTRDLARALGLSESTVSHHLHALTLAGLTTPTRHGRYVLYALTELGHELRSRLV
jgi:DNA-binding transcriptional ArsR family regulator